MLARDVYGIIGQHDIYDLSTRPDGGDSARSTAMMAISGSQQDRQLIKIWGPLVRNPFQTTISKDNGKAYNDPTGMSRDQVACLWAANVIIGCIPNKTFEGNFVNQDLLDPSYQWLRAKAEGRETGIHKTLGTPFLIAGILWQCTIKPDHEVNQMLCMTLALGEKYTALLIQLHPDFTGNLKDYWCGWRDQKEIFDAIIVDLKRRKLL